MNIQSMGDKILNLDRVSTVPHSKEDIYLSMTNILGTAFTLYPSEEGDKFVKAFTEIREGDINRALLFFH